MHFFLIPIAWVMFIAIADGIFVASCSYVEEELRRDAEWKWYDIDKSITQERIQECTGEKK